MVIVCSVGMLYRLDCGRIQARIFHVLLSVISRISLIGAKFLCSFLFLNFLGIIYSEISHLYVAQSWDFSLPWETPALSPMQNQNFYCFCQPGSQNVPMAHYVESATPPGFKFSAEVSVPTPISHRSKVISSVSAPASMPPAPVHLELCPGLVSTLGPWDISSCT